MKTDLDIESLLIEFFQQFSDREINRTTSVNNDLQLVGSDVSLITFCFKKEFGVTLNHDDLQPYFLDEFNVPFQYTYYKFFKPSKLLKSPLTIAHLIEVVRRGSWFAP